MPSFNITANGSLAGQVLTVPSTAIFIGGVIGKAKILLEASPDNTNWAPVSKSVDIAGSIAQGPNGGAVAQCILPAGWFVRTNTQNADLTTNANVVVA